MAIQLVFKTEPKVRKDYLEKLDRIRKGKFIQVDDFKKRYLK